MQTVTSYNTPQQFLDATESILEQKELENNLVLGLCNRFADKTKPQENCVFINVIEDGIIRASSIKTLVKAIVSGTTKNTSHMKALADYYLDHDIDLAGAVGETFYASEFADFYGKKQVDAVTLIVHRLDTVNTLPLAPGNLLDTSMDDIALLSEWLMAFEAEENVFPKQSREQIVEIFQTRVGKGAVFKWVDKGEIVSFAGLARKTRNVGIIGPVYTPPELRGQGYATSCVLKLSELILASGFTSCGLFTDKANPTSNRIYKKIGYVPVSEFLDIGFELSEYD